eukprot:scaffold898_cov120-Skeletonema_marinoi.AAC.5
MIDDGEQHGREITIVDAICFVEMEMMPKVISEKMNENIDEYEEDCGQGCSVQYVYPTSRDTLDSGKQESIQPAAEFVAISMLESISF